MRSIFSKLGKARRILHQPPVSMLLALAISGAGISLGLLMILRGADFLVEPEFQKPMESIPPQCWGILLLGFGLWVLIRAFHKDKIKRRRAKLPSLLLGLTFLVFSGFTFSFVLEGGLPHVLVTYVVIASVCFITMISFMEVHHDEVTNEDIERPRIR